jgi:acyl-CoA reductase-like NAD-dependent aldehyde dehydrogenase
VERLYVHTRIYDRFLERFLEVVRGFVVGDPMAEDTYIGPVTRPGQLGVLAGQVTDAVAKGGNSAWAASAWRGPATSSHRP